MNEDDETEVVLLDRPVIYVEAEEIVDSVVGFEDVTAQYQLAEVEDDYDDVTVIGEPADDQPVEVVLLDLMRIDPVELEVA